jgi:hypothetical protein
VSKGRFCEIILEIILLNSNVAIWDKIGDAMDEDCCANVKLGSALRFENPEGKIPL